MNRYKISKVFSILSLLVLIFSCKDYLDVVPDNVATLENAFSRRTEAEKYLYTCYSYLPRNGNLADDPAMLGGDELWRFSNIRGYLDIARGFQTTVNPLGDRWTQFYQAIRDCNTFLANVNKVPDVDETEKRRWIAEAKFLKGYYHFLLMRMYGPVPIMDENIPIDAQEEQIVIARAPVDAVVSYIVKLINEARKDLPLTIGNPARELGRISIPIALSVKAQVLVYAASPLFNGNIDVAGLVNRDGTPLFNTTYSVEKWRIAAEACKNAIDTCHLAGVEIFEYPANYQAIQLTSAIRTQLSIRTAITQRWNSEIIWANSLSNSAGLQSLMQPHINPANLNITSIRGEVSPTLKIAEMYYSENGVPISEDKTWTAKHPNRFALKTASAADQLYIKKDYTTAALHYDREPRFYANLGFDGSVWYGQGVYTDKAPTNLYHVEAKFRQRNGFGKPGFGTITGYYVKKLIHFENVIGVGNDYSITNYPFPVIRLADLYLMYAEALNEAVGPTNEVHKYIDLVRNRAGLPPVKTSWDNFSSNPSAYQSMTGMREIIHRERLIELSFEGHRFWDLRRWKKAAAQLNTPVRGWDLGQVDASSYYRPNVIYNQNFNLKDYFWPINENTIARNRNLVQNLGW